jgi:hypothetical protein
MSVLSAVSCLSNRLCEAVGDQVHGSATRSLVERFNGTHWLTVASVSPNLHSSLWGVSCLSWNSCEAVGSVQSSTSSTTLVETWNGHRWGVARSDNPSSMDGFNGVSCVSSAQCLPVGYELVGAGVYDSLIERGA